MSVALLLDLYYTGGWQKLLSSLLIYLSVCFADSWQKRESSSFKMKEHCMAEYITHSREETVALGRKLAAVLPLSLIHI